ncbi:MAG: 6-carboxytetrahydropterin synthase QueD [Candidatus Omnitrophota bacterium]|jgi:6-pyruvoyltetrahydropterin/6-carboxytetrahydropterin synthase
MFEIKVIGQFSAAHNLRGYRGRCEELHGHNWKVEVSVSGEKLDKAGMLMDFKQLRMRLNKVLDRLDHKYITRLTHFKRINPTSENIAKYIYQSLKAQTPDLKSVTVWESDSSSASYYGG